MNLFDNAFDVVFYYSAFGFMLAFVIYIFVVMSGMALGIFRMGKDFDISK